MQAQLFDISEQKREAAEEFGKLDALVREFAPIKGRHEARRNSYRPSSIKTPADKEFLIDGPSYVIEIAPRAFECTVINMALLAKALGSRKPSQNGTEII